MQVTYTATTRQHELHNSSTYDTSAVVAVDHTDRGATAVSALKYLPEYPAWYYSVRMTEDHETGIDDLFEVRGVEQ